MLKLLIPYFYYSRIMLFLYLQDTVSLYRFISYGISLSASAGFSTIAE